MRSDDPSSLKEIILLVQKSVQRVKTNRSGRDRDRDARDKKSSSSRNVKEDVPEMDERRRSEMENQLKDKKDEHEHKLRHMDNEYAAEVRLQESQVD